MKEHFEDRSARARRHELSPADARQLDEELQASADARFWHRAGTAFDAEDTVLPGDHEASERVMQRLLRELPRATAPRSRTRWVALLAAAAVLVASIAGAAAFGVRRLRQPAPKPAPAPSSLRPAETALTPSALPSAAPAAADSGAPVLTPPTLGPAPAVSALLPSSASELLSAAGRARRHGHAREAITLLDGLQQRFPNSPEARSSDLTLGMLQLKSGSSAAALRHFDRYLQRSPDGALASEALWGQAQAYFAQGNSAQARRSLGTLLQRFPSSARASAARAQLGAAAP